MTQTERPDRCTGWGFWILAAAWLPGAELGLALVRFGADVTLILAEPAGWVSLVVFVPCGLPLALGCRRLWRLGRRRAAWAAGAGLGAVTIPVALVAGLFGPAAVVAGAAVLSLPVWAAAWWLARRVPHPGGHR